MRREPAMFKRFCVISAVICLALLTLSILGFSLLGMHARALQSERMQEFDTVAKKVQADIKKKLDDFLVAEQNRPYTDYQLFYIPIAANGGNALVRSPLAEGLANGLAYGYFQIDAANEASLPVDPENEKQEQKQYFDNINNNLITALVTGSSDRVIRVTPVGSQQEYIKNDISSIYSSVRQNSSVNFANQAREQATSDESQAKGKVQQPQQQRLAIDINQANQMAKIQDTNIQNMYNNKALINNYEEQADGLNQALPELQTNINQQQAIFPFNATVQARIEPFVPITIASEDGSGDIFPGQVFMLRHVQIQTDHYLQGFRLNEVELKKQVEESAGKFLLRGMNFEVDHKELQNAAYSAVLDFGFGELALNLLELEPGWIPGRVASFRSWFYAIIVIVWTAVAASLFMFWKNMSQQAALARKKDDFISAVSHELRTPLTSIRMYTEMLENNWVKSDEKRQEYYAGMRQECQRLTRLVENVLDFSRIQRGKKQYKFLVGNINDIVSKTVEMLVPCADKAGFTIHTELGQLPEFRFDSDSVTQIVINLVDNALKYACEAQDRQIIVRTRQDKGFILLEVEDHGPGIARSQQKKIFEEFYRCGDENTRQTVGTGLGLALVRKLAEAHNGLVEIATPGTASSGALFRVKLAI